MKTMLRKSNDRLTFRTASAAALLLVAILLAWGCAGIPTYKVESRPLAGPITVDGKDDDWRGNLYYSVQGQFSLGFINDQKDLYVCLVVTDPYKRARILRGGLILWIDPKGGQAKTFGLRFPVGPAVGADQSRTEGRPVSLEPTDFEEEFGQTVSSESWTEFGVITPKSQMPLLVKTEDGKGVEIKAAAPIGMFIYELKIPLRNSDQAPWAVGAQPGQTISLGFETGRLSSGLMSRGPGDMGGRGRYPGSGYGRPGMSGDDERGGFGRGIQIPEELKVWAVVKLLQ